MPQTNSEVIAQCPNPKCRKPIYADYSNAWCVECGEYFPENVRAQIPKLQKIRAEASAYKAADQTTTEAALTRRYGDAYLVGRTTVGFGSFIKAIGVLSGAIIVLLSILVLADSRDQAMFSLGVMGIVFGCFVGILLYIFGVLVSAQGQVLKATLDGAVNSSPFLIDEDKAEIMSLPKPKAVTIASS
jgi:hypothetical protein